MVTRVMPRVFKGEAGLWHSHVSPLVCLESGILVAFAGLPIILGQKFKELSLFHSFLNDFFWGDCDQWTDIVMVYTVPF